MHPTNNVNFILKMVKLMHMSPNFISWFIQQVHAFILQRSVIGLATCVHSSTLFHL
jgi:hypothetical protein